MFFYALFPLLIVWIRRLRPVAVGVLLAVGFLAQAIWIFAIRVIFEPVVAQGLYTQFPLTHLFEFVVGIAAAHLLLQHRAALAARPWARVAFLTAGLAGILVIGIVQPITPVYFLMTPMFAMVVLALALPTGGRRSWLALPGVVRLGEASYALYLVHVPIGFLLVHQGVSGPFGWVAALVVVAASILVLRYWEAPARRFIRHRWSAAQRRDG